METKVDATQEMPTLSQVVNKAVDNGFVENFKVTTKGMTTETEGRFYKPEEIKISNFYRFEGYSDPSDNCILYIIETTDGKKGTLMDVYGAEANSKLTNFIREVEDIQKKTKK